MKRLRINREGMVKEFLSLALVIFAIYVAITTKNLFAFFFFSFSNLGDTSIMASRGTFSGKKKNTFTLGVVFFAMAHVFYILAMKTQYSIILGKVDLILCIFVIILSIYPSARNDKLNFIPYAVCLIINVFNACMFSIIAGIGGFLFLASDGILSICEERNPKWQIAIWATYVPAQILLLTSILMENR